MIKKQKLKRLFLQVILYIIGLFILALGVAFSIKSGLGVSPVNSIPYVLSLILNIELSTTVIIVFVIFIILQVLIMQKDFKIYNLSQILFAILFGYFADFTNNLVSGINPTSYIMSLAMLSISIFFVALGISLYVGANLINMPMEGLVIAVNEKILPQKTFADVKIVLDIIVVTIAGILSLYFFSGFNGVREGTIISALLVGIIMKLIQKFILPLINYFKQSDLYLINILF